MYITGVAKAGGLGGQALLTKSFGYWKDRQTGVGPHFLGKFLARKLQKITLFCFSDFLDFF